MGHIEITHLDHILPDGRTLLDDVSFRVGEGGVAALVGPNGAGRTTLLRLVAGDLSPQSGTVARSGGIGVMRQFIGTLRGSSTVADLLLSIAPTRIRAAAAALENAEPALLEHDDERAQIRYATALTEWGDAGGYEIEVVWDACSVAALGTTYDARLQILLPELSGATLLLLDEPTDNLDPAGAEALQDGLDAYAGTVLAVTHDRWFARSFDRFIVFSGDGSVYESPEPVWDETRVARPHRPPTPRVSAAS
jgi:ATPase subunit of ABC transporter with duplicated ATPase domains